MGSCGRLGESPNTWKHFGPDPTQAQYSVNSVLVRQETVTWGGWTWALIRFPKPLRVGIVRAPRATASPAGRPAMDSGSRITGGGSGYVAHFAHAGGVLYGTELGLVTFKRDSLERDKKRAAGDVNDAPAAKKHSNAPPSAETLLPRRLTCRKHLYSEARLSLNPSTLSCWNPTKMEPLHLLCCSRKCLWLMHLHSY